MNETKNETNRPKTKNEIGTTLAELTRATAAGRARSAVYDVTPPRPAYLQGS